MAPSMLTRVLPLMQSSPSYPYCWPRVSCVERYRLSNLRFCVCWQASRARARAGWGLHGCEYLDKRGWGCNSMPQYRYQVGGKSW